MPPDSSDPGPPTAPLAGREEVRSLVLAAGFDRVGFAPAGPAPHARDLRRWVERGFAGSMDYIARTLERRQDPRRLLEGARTVIAAAVTYRQPGGPEAAAPAPGRGRIASYALGDDYHRALEARLRRACEALAARFGGRHRWYADTGPVLERDWAERAGVGWIGKNACAIDAARGSYFFLGEILTTLEIEPDAPAEDLCGSCRLCIDVCPTGALVAPRELDARRCISYLTIEHRGPLPEDLEAALGGLVFGCDICQDVCPFNRREGVPGADPELEPRPENLDPALEDLAALDREGFRARFPRSAVRRARFEGFLRNVIAALGNWGGARASAVLERLAAREDLRTDPTMAVTLERARRRAAGASRRPA
ncbi:MAG: tRNA epoxyqueuosine(34) reductase QueG [Planctomycetes bacterium]|nr:tRNA epoxyqueuosine(34) reductase QueG [Planctomycetota bacterium]